MKTSNKIMAGFAGVMVLISIGFMTYNYIRYTKCYEQVEKVAEILENSNAKFIVVENEALLVETGDEIGLLSYGPTVPDIEIKGDSLFINTRGKFYYPEAEYIIRTDTTIVLKEEIISEDE